jgi:hypothetical protein
MEGAGASLNRRSVRVKRDADRSYVRTRRRLAAIGIRTYVLCTARYYTPFLLFVAFLQNNGKGSTSNATPPFISEGIAKAACSFSTATFRRFYTHRDVTASNWENRQPPRHL